MHHRTLFPSDCSVNKGGACWVSPPYVMRALPEHRPWPENKKAFLSGADNLDESSHIIRDQSVFTNQLKLWVEVLLFTHQPS